LRQLQVKLTVPKNRFARLAAIFGKLNQSVINAHINTLTNPGLPKSVPTAESPLITMCLAGKVDQGKKQVAITPKQQRMPIN
jgi:hypothetical protein